MIYFDLELECFLRTVNWLFYLLPFFLLVVFTQMV